jgi:hypothetical protein
MFLGAAALALFGIFAPYRWHDMPSWLTSSALLVALFLALWAVGIWLPGPAKGIKKSMAAMLIAAGVCALIVGVVLWLDRAETSDDEYIVFDVENLGPSNLTGPFALWIANAAPGPFEHVDSWFSPWAAAGDGHNQAYWSIGQFLKVVFPVLQHGRVLFGREIPPGDYLIQCDATLRGLSYHFDEHLEIREQDGAFIQSIEVRRRISGKDDKVVYSSQRPVSTGIND